MAHQIIERPAAFCISKNEIRYVYKVTNLTRIGLYLEMQLFYCRADGTVDSSFPSFKLVPNPDGTVYLYLQLYIDSLLQWAIPNPIDNLVAAQTQSCSFYIATREIDDATTGTVSWNTSESVNRRIALKMGIEKNRYSRNNLLNYLLNNNSFFTWQPNGRLTFANQPNYLSFLLPVGNSNGYQLKVVFQTIQGTNDDIITPLAANAAYLFHIKTDPTTLGITIPDGEQLHWYEISILDSNNIIVVGSYRYYIDYDTFYHYHDFIYINSLGGIDTARAKGEIEYSFDRSVDEIEGGFSLNNSISAIKQAETIYRAITLRRIYKGDLGFRRSKPEQDAMIELLASTAIYELLDGNLIPLLQIQKTHSLRKTTDMILPFAIEWQHAETNEVYTPTKVSVGTATDTEVYNGYVFISFDSSVSVLNIVLLLSTGILINNIPGYIEWSSDYTPSDWVYISSHNGPLNANDIQIVTNGIGYGAALPITATLYINGILVEALNVKDAGADGVVSKNFTTSLEILQSDLIEIIIS